MARVEEGEDALGMLLDFRFAEIDVVDFLVGERDDGFAGRLLITELRVHGETAPLDVDRDGRQAFSHVNDQIEVGLVFHFGCQTQTDRYPEKGRTRVFSDRSALRFIRFCFLTFVHPSVCLSFIFLKQLLILLST